MATYDRALRISVTNVTRLRPHRGYLVRMEFTASAATLPDTLCMSVVECSLPASVTLPMRRTQRFAPRESFISAIRKALRV